MQYTKLHSLFLFISLSMFISSLFGCKSSDNQFQSLSVDEFEQSIQDPNIIRLDVRTSEEYAAGHLSGAVNIDVLQPDFEKNCLKTLPKQHTIAVYCRGGNRSKKAARILSKQHFKVIELNTGYMGWIQEGKNISKE